MKQNRKCEKAGTVQMHRAGFPTNWLTVNYHQHTPSGPAKPVKNLAFYTQEPSQLRDLCD